MMIAFVWACSDAGPPTRGAAGSAGDLSTMPPAVPEVAPGGAGNIQPAPSSDSDGRDIVPPPIAGVSGQGASEEPSTPDVPAIDDLRRCDGDSANPAGYCFRSVAIGGGGFVSAIVMSEREPDLIYSRTDVGGAYRWNEATESWIPLNDWVSETETGLLGIESLALDPNEPSRLYMLAGIDYFNNGKTAVLASDDYGATFRVHEVTSQFRAHGNGNGRQNGERLAVDPIDGTVLFVGTRQDGLFRSTDRGESWSAVASLEVPATPGGAGVAFVSFDPAAGELAGASRRLFVGVSRAGAPNLFESNDGGATFAPVAGHPTEFMPQRAEVAEDGVLYVTYGNGAGPQTNPSGPMDRGAIWALDLTSGAWSEITPLRGASNRAFSGFSVDKADSQRLLATTINTYQRQPWGFGDRMFLSTDGGASWTDLIGTGRVTMATGGMPWIEQQAIHWAGSIRIDPFDPERAFVTSGNGVFMTRNLSAANSTWTFAARGLEEMVPLDAASVSGAPLLTVVGDYDGFIHDDPDTSPTGGRHAPTMGTTQSLAIAALDPARLARVGSELYVSSDGAQSWVSVTRPSAAIGGSLALSADGSVLIWGVGSAAYRSSDLGANWTPVAGWNVNAMPAADAVDPNIFYAYVPQSGTVLVSNDAGSSFAPASSLPNGGARRIRAVPGVRGELWVALNGGGLRRSTDSGATFTTVAAVQSCRAVGFGAPQMPGGFPAVYIWGSASGGPRGLYRSVDAGQSFVRINDDAHEFGGPGNGEFVIGDANVFGRVYMSSAGRGLIMGELADTN
jgi:xyloglucan-specific exo-beta-1,4-glucanase